MGSYSGPPVLSLDQLITRRHDQLQQVLASQHHVRAHDHSLVEDGSPIAAVGVPQLDASKIGSGVFDVSRIPDLDASKITTGILSALRGGLGKELDLTWLANGYIICYRASDDKWYVRQEVSMYPQTLSLGGYVQLTNIGTSYDTIDASRGLGIAYVSFLGVGYVNFRVYVRKVGSGTQSWQLWNETDSSQLCVINDAGAEGYKVLQTGTMTLPTTWKLVRVRAKSTVAGDDPIYFGASLTLEG